MLKQIAYLDRAFQSPRQQDVDR